MSDYKQGLPLLSRLVRFNSVDDSNASVKSEFKINISKALSTSKVVKVSLKSASFVNVAYNITSRNNVFTYIDNVTSTDVTVPIGQYTITQYIAVMVPLWNAALSAGTMAITQDPYNKKLTFTSTGTPQITLLPKATNPAGNLLGITSNIVIATGASETSQSVPRFQGLSEVFLSIGSKNIDSSNMADPSNGCSNRNIFTNIPIIVAFGGINHYLPNDENLESITFNSPIDIDEIAFRLEDRESNLIDLQNTNLRGVLKLYYINK